MLKKLTIIAALVTTAGYLYGQGTVNFNTLVLGTEAQVRNADGTLLAGTGFWAQLWAAPGVGQPESALLPAGTPVNFRGGVNSGYVQTTGTTILGPVSATVIVTPTSGGPATVQLRAWAGPETSYTAAVGAGRNHGVSQVLSLGATGDPNASPPVLPPDLVGLRGFNLVPEPSTIGLAILGAGALLLLRRRK